MHYAGPLDLLPIWGVFLATMAVVLLAVEGGFRLGQYRRRRSEQEDRPPVGEMVAATLAVMEVEKATGRPDPNRPNLIGIRDRAIIAVCLYSG